MTSPSGPLNPLARRLLNGYQRHFPLETRPFARIARELGCEETTVLAEYGRMRGEGVVSRIGPVFAPGRVGASTLAALAVPPERLEEVAERINGYQEVNHNYAREHRYNLWFVVTAADRARLDARLDAIRRETGLPLLDLPMLEGFHIDLGFDLEGAEARSIAADGEAATPRALSPAEERTLTTLQAGLSLVAEPYRELATRAGLSEEELLDHIRAWLDEGLVKRFGVVVRHRELGFSANAMVVWAVPESEVRRAGRALAALPWITLCYRRPARPPEWPYTLFCMIHGREREPVLRQVEEAARQAGLEGVERAVLFSGTRYKQRGARYREAPAHG